MMNKINAQSLCDAVLENFKLGNSLREFYPPLKDDPAEKSYLWAYFAATGMLYHACKYGLDYKADFKRLIDGLSFYRAKPWSDTEIKYHSGRGDEPGGGHGDCFFDDNIWVARNLLFAHELFGDDAYLQEARRVAAYVYIGWNHELCGLVWNERGLTPEGTAQELERGLSANACSILVSAKLYKLTGDKTYLDWAHKFYDFCKTVQDPKSGIYYNGVHTLIENGVRKAGRVNRDLYGYNSGSMILADLELYTITKSDAYIADAVRAAKATHKAHLRTDREIPYYRDFNWFFAVFMEGCTALLAYEPDAVSEVFTTQREALAYGARYISPAGLLPHDYVTGWRKNAPADAPVDYYDRNLLTHSGTAEMAVLTEMWR